MASTATAMAATTSNNPSNCSSTYPQIQLLEKHGPVFGISGDNVEIIQEPTEFYDILKEQAHRARKRIVLASLYLGTGSLERDLVNVIHDSVRTHSTVNDPLKVEILLDFTRGSRGQDNSRTMLLPMLKEFESQVQVSLYHSPDLRGWLKWTLPERWNEVVGLNHLKVYLFDDNLIMSGANLSDSYFTNRQDRYILLKNCPGLADFFHNLVSSVSDVSFRLQNDDTVTLAPGLENHPFEDKDGGAKYREEARDKLSAFLDRYSATNTHETQEISTKSSEQTIDTWVYPLLQMPPFSITTDEKMTLQYFKQAPEGSSIHLGSGYFNLTDAYMDTLLSDSSAFIKILSASPQANGFFNGAGVSGYIPDAYTYIAKQFMARVNQHQQQDRITLFEYFREGWTFHGKGLWHYLPGEVTPFVTFIGSSNFGYRSVYRDLEAQLVIATENVKLRQSLHLEQSRLFEMSQKVDCDSLNKPDRAVPMWVTYVTSVIRKFF